MNFNLPLVGCSCLVLLALSTTVHAGRCDDVRAALQQERNLFQVKQTVDEQRTEYRKGPNITLSVLCPFDKPNVMISWDGPSPDHNFYDLVGRAGSLVSPRTAADIVHASKRCRQQVLKGDVEISSIEQKDLVIECQAFKRDGGATIIFVFAQ